MKERTERFLKSIGIDDVSSFDIDFISIIKSKYFPNRFIFSVEKDTPWEYGLLDYTQCQRAI